MKVGTASMAMEQAVLRYRMIAPGRVNDNYSDGRAT